MRYVILLICFAVCACSKTTPPPSSQDIEHTDWMKVLHQEPGIIFQSLAADTTKHKIIVKADTNISGIPALNYALYFDFDHDGKKEAIIPLVTEESFIKNEEKPKDEVSEAPELKGFLVFEDNESRPQLTDWSETAAGLDLSIEEGKLLADSKVWARWQEMENSTGWSNGDKFILYDIVHGKLHIAKEWSAGDTSKAIEAVLYLFDSFEEMKFQNAYRLFSPHYQSQHPYEKWKKDFERYGGGLYSKKTLGSFSEDSTIAYTLKLKNSAIEQGAWKLIWNSDSTAWFLDSLILR